MLTRCSTLVVLAVGHLQACPYAVTTWSTIGTGCCVLPTADDSNLPFLNSEFFIGVSPSRPPGAHRAGAPSHRHRRPCERGGGCCLAQRERVPPPCHSRVDWTDRRPSPRAAKTAGEVWL